MAVAPRTGPPTDYKLGKKLGQGAFGTVHQCCDQETGEEMAVKTVNLPSGGEPAKRDLRALQNEMKLLTACQHERIVQYYGVAKSTDGFCIFLELLPGGTVSEQIQRDGPLKEPLALKYTQQILEGLAYLHSKRVIHRDVKGANVLRDIKGNVKLADFGVSKQMNMIADSAGMTVVGTRRWMAPEVLLGNYDFKADIWSVGCTVVEMLTGEPPQVEVGLELILAFVLNPQPKYTLPPSTSEKMKKLLKLAFQKSATDRPSASRLLRSFFVSQNAASSLSSGIGIRNGVPTFWAAQSDTEHVKLVRLNPNSAEYASVKTNLTSSSACHKTNILFIERIQNPRLYKKYMARKVVLDKQNPGIDNERTLWHGTPASNIVPINRCGFDPAKFSMEIRGTYPTDAYKHEIGSAQCFGEGVYFAVRASYSLECYYSIPDSHGNKRVYQCKVLVGHACEGNHDMKIPPKRSASIRYDSTTDKVAAPQEYVIFQNDSAYPQYLITVNCEHQDCDCHKLSLQWRRGGGPEYPWAPPALKEKNKM